MPSFILGGYMLKDLQPIKIPITLAGNKTYLRYNMHSRAYLETYYPNYNEFMKQDFEEMPILDTMHLLRAGLIDSYSVQNEKYLDEFDYKNVYPKMSTLGKILSEENKLEMMEAIANAFLQALPVATVGTKNFQRGKAQK